MDSKELQNFIKFYEAYKQAEKAGPSANGTAVPVHGPGGLFGGMGFSRDVLSTIFTARGIAQYLQAIGTNVSTPLYPFLLGQEADIGSEPDDSCGDAVQAGAKKAGTLTAQFGFLQRRTGTIDPSQIIKQVNRGEFTDLRLMNNFADGSGMGPQNLTDSNAILNNTIYKEMQSVGHSLSLKLSKTVWDGSTAVNTAGYKEFPGLDAQITTGQVDAETGTLMPAADSYVQDLNFSDVNGTGTNDIVRYITDMVYQLGVSADYTGVNVDWVFVMRPQLWEMLTEYWPISYLVTGNVVSGLPANTSINVSASDEIRARDAMRESMTLYVRGKRFKVILDTGISELNNSDNANIAIGSYASNIYMLPVTVNNMPMTRVEYLDYRNLSPYLSQTGQLAGKVTFWSPDGRFLWVYRDHPGLCFDLQVRTEQRIVLQAPHLAGRINNVQYSPLTHIKEPYPASPYFKNGGISQQPVDTKYHVW